MFDIEPHYERAVAANVQLWHRRLLLEADVDRWQAQAIGIWQAVAAGLEYTAVQEAAATLAADLNPLMEHWGLWQEWLPLLETAVGLLLPSQLKGRLLLAKGRIYFLNRNFSDAVRVETAALALFEANQQTDLIAQAHHQLSNTFLGHQKYDLARQHGANALRLVNANQTALLAKLHNTMGLIELETGNFPASEAQFQQAIHYMETLNDPTSLARAWLNLSVTYQRQNQLAAAQTCCQQALDILPNAASNMDGLKISNMLGVLHYQRNNFVEAEKIFRQGLLDLRYMPGMIHLRGSFTHNLGNTVLSLERWEEAKIHLEKSILLWQQTDDKVQQANSLGTLGELYEKQGEWTTAVTYYNNALQQLSLYPQNQWGRRLIASFEAAKARCVAQMSASDTL